jgi:hypothetical protein
MASIFSFCTNSSPADELRYPSNINKKANDMCIANRSAILSHSEKVMREAKDLFIDTFKAGFTLANRHGNIPATARLNRTKQSAGNDLQDSRLVNSVRIGRRLN